MWGVALPLVAGAYGGDVLAAVYRVCNEVLEVLQSWPAMRPVWVWW